MAAGAPEGLGGSGLLPWGAGPASCRGAQRAVVVLGAARGHLRAPGPAGLPCTPCRWGFSTRDGDRARPPRVVGRARLPSGKDASLQQAQPVPLAEPGGPLPKALHPRSLGRFLRLPGLPALSERGGRRCVCRVALCGQNLVPKPVLQGRSYPKRGHGERGLVPWSLVCPARVAGQRWAASTLGTEP